MIIIIKFHTSHFFIPSRNHQLSQYPWTHNPHSYLNFIIPAPKTPNSPGGENLPAVRREPCLSKEARPLMLGEDGSGGRAPSDKADRSGLPISCRSSRIFFAAASTSCRKKIGCDKKTQRFCGSLAQAATLMTTNSKRHWMIRSRQNRILCAICQRPPLGATSCPRRSGTRPLWQFPHLSGAVAKAK